jgi:hypothetical protein
MDSQDKANATEIEDRQTERMNGKEAEQGQGRINGVGSGRGRRGRKRTTSL